GINSVKYAPIAFGILFAYVIFAYDFVETIPVLNWSWLGYNIAFGRFADQGLWWIVPFVPLLVYMFIHINYVEELYFRRSKKMVIVCAVINIAMGVKCHMAVILLPIGFVFKYSYGRKGICHSYAMHFGTNIPAIRSLCGSFII